MPNSEGLNPPGEGLTPLEIYSVIATATMAILLSVLAWLSAHHSWWLWLAVSVGALGGLAHEIAQSGGKILFLQRHDDGMYLGSLAGMVLRAVAGVLVIRGHLIASASGATPSVSAIQLEYEIFFAGLALKGLQRQRAASPSRSSAFPKYGNAFG